MTHGEIPSVRSSEMGNKNQLKEKSSEGILFTGI